MPTPWRLSRARVTRLRSRQKWHFWAPCPNPASSFLGWTRSTSVGTASWSVGEPRASADSSGCALVPAGSAAFWPNWTATVSRSRPFLSVIVPAHQGQSLLPDTLGVLRRSDLPKEEWELIVIDDASQDRTALVAAEYADTVVRLPGEAHGLAFARNRGFEVSRSDVLVFVDADVRVHASSLRQFAESFRAHPDLGAVFGSYDDQPPAQGVVSRYRNLLHHYHHHRGAGDAGTFWAGLGAVRANVFMEVDKYDEWRYERPQIEDIELGRRIVHAGYRILLDPTIQGTHLKGWTLRDLLCGDLFHRGIPWMTLILREGGAGISST